MNTSFGQSCYVLLEFFLERETDKEQRVFLFILFSLLFNALLQNMISVRKLADEDIDEVYKSIQGMQEMVREINPILYYSYQELEEILPEDISRFIKKQDKINCIFYVNDFNLAFKLLKDYDQTSFSLPVIFHEGQCRFFLHKYFYHLTCLRRFLKQRLENNIFDWSICANQELIPFFKKSKLDRKQILAISSSLANQFTLICGGPGTGKTTIAGAIVYLYLMSQKKAEIVLTSLTGKATDKLSTTIQQYIRSFNQSVSKELTSDIHIRSKTIHHLLEYNHYQEKFRYGFNNPLQIDLLIIDESSMLDIVLINQLFAAISFSTKIIMLGDVNQLTPVHPGAILEDIQYFLQKYHDLSMGFSEHNRIIGLGDPLLVSSSEHLIFLETVYRSRSFIQEYARSVLNTGCLSIDTRKSSFNKNGENYINLFQDQSSDKIIEHWFSQVFLQKYNTNLEKEPSTFLDLLLKVRDCDLFSLSNKESESYLIICHLLSYFTEHSLKYLTETIDKIGNIQSSCILTFTKESIRGTYHYNQLISEMLVEETGEHHDIHIKWHHGVPILLLENLYDLGLYNGDIGITIMTAGKQLYGIFVKKDALVAYPISSLRSIEPAFAMTVHKSQGSEFHRVLLVTPSLEHEQESLQKQQYLSLMYTGITRAKEYLTIDTTPNFLEGNYSTSKREKTLLDF